MNNPPAFQFYPADFLADENVALMSLTARGAYITLLCYCWREGSIPADMSRMGKLCGIDGSAMAQLWEELYGCFELANGRYINPRLEKERIKQVEFRTERKESGRKGALSRWKKGTGDPEGFTPQGMGSTPDGSAIAKPMAQPIAKNGSSSSSSSSEEEVGTASRSEEEITSFDRLKFLLMQSCGVVPVNGTELQIERAGSEIVQMAGAEYLELFQLYLSEQGAKAIKLPFVAKDFGSWNAARKRASTVHSSTKPKKQFCGKCNHGWLPPDRAKGETRASHCPCTKQQRATQ